MKIQFTHTFRLLAEAVIAGILVGSLIIWQQGGFSPPTASSSYAKAVDKAAPAVVNIYTARKANAKPKNDSLGRYFQQTDPRRIEASLGSGVIVSSKGYILTSYHVIKDASTIIIALPDGRESQASIVGSDPATDLALLQIKLDKLPTIDLSIQWPVHVGDVVLAIGNPMGIGQTVSMGIIGATGRSHLGIATFENFIQTDAAINRGNSGGALVDTEGKLVGINTAILSDDGRWQGIGFATPTPIAEKVMNDLINDGHVIRGFLGVTAQNISPELAHSVGLDGSSGAVVTQILTPSPAASAGLRPGDLLININGKPIRNGYDAMNRVASSSPGDVMTFSIWRQGKLITLNVTVGERPRRLDSD